MTPPNPSPTHPRDESTTPPTPSYKGGVGVGGFSTTQALGRGKRMKPTAASRSAAIMRKLDEAVQRVDLRHAPHCSGGPLVTSKGYSFTTTTCQTCKAVASVRHGAS